jgi:hypothetical protein
MFLGIVENIICTILKEQKGELLGAEIEPELQRGKNVVSSASRL